MGLSLPRICRHRPVRRVAVGWHDDAASRGDALLSAVDDADWLVMGALRRGRFLVWLFGGLSAAVLHDAMTPLFLAHRWRVDLERDDRR